MQIEPGVLGRGKDRYVLCGWLLQSKTFLVRGFWSEAVLCLACLRGASDRWP